MVLAEVSVVGGGEQGDELNFYSAPFEPVTPIVT